MSARITLGKSLDDGSIKHISDVKNGLECNCKCIECEEILIAINNENNVREFHFRHEHDSDCKGGVETALHLLSKQIILENKKILIDKDQYFNYSKAIDEYKLGDLTPDIIIENQEGKKWLIEIAVTHKVESEKLDKIKKRNFNCLEIDISKVDKEINRIDMREILIENSNYRTILNREKTVTETIHNNHSFRNIIGAVGIIAGLGLVISELFLRIKK